jgi:hypothetical protein
MCDWSTGRPEVGGGGGGGDISCHRSRRGGAAGVEAEGFEVEEGGRALSWSMMNASVYTTHTETRSTEHTEHA